MLCSCWQSPFRGVQNTSSVWDCLCFAVLSDIRTELATSAGCPPAALPQLPGEVSRPCCAPAPHCPQPTPPEGCGGAAELPATAGRCRQRETAPHQALPAQCETRNGTGEVFQHVPIRSTARYTPDTRERLKWKDFVLKEIFSEAHHLGSYAILRCKPAVKELMFKSV